MAWCDVMCGAVGYVMYTCVSCMQDVRAYTNVCIDVINVCKICMYAHVHGRMYACVAMCVEAWAYRYV